MIGQSIIACANGTACSLDHLSVFGESPSTITIIGDTADIKRTAAGALLNLVFELVFQGRALAPTSTVYVLELTCFLPITSSHVLYAFQMARGRLLHLGETSDYVIPQ